MSIGQIKKGAPAKGLQGQKHDIGLWGSCGTGVKYRRKNELGVFYNISVRGKHEYDKSVLQSGPFGACLLPTTVI